MSLPTRSPVTTALKCSGALDPVVMLVSPAPGACLSPSVLWLLLGGVSGEPALCALPLYLPGDGGGQFLLPH